MRLNKLALIGLLCAGYVHAEVIIVEEFSSNQSIHTAKVISKQPIFGEIVQTVSKPVCRNIVSSSHYDNRGKIDVVYRDRIRCSSEFSTEIIKVLKGYSVTYEYNGKYFSAILDHDPGEYVSVHSGK